MRTQLAQFRKPPRGADAREREEKKRCELEDAHQVATLDLTVAIAVYLDDEGGDGNNGNEQDGDKDEHEVPFKRDGVARHGGDIARV